MASEQATKQYCEYIKLKQELIKRGGVSLAQDAIHRADNIIGYPNSTQKRIAEIKELVANLAEILSILEDGQRDVDWAIKQLDKLSPDKKESQEQ